MAKHVELTVVDRGGKPFIVVEDDEFEMVHPRSVEKQFLNQVGSSLARSWERQMAVYGISVGEGRKIAGEYVLSTKLAPITSLGMPEGYKCINVMLRNDAISQPHPVMFSNADLEQIKKTLNEDGLVGPRGSVLVAGETETRGTWPLRQTVLKAKHWMVLGNTNDMAHLLKESAKAGMKSIKLAMDVYNMDAKLSRRH